MQLVSDDVVASGYAHELGEFVLEGGVLLAQNFDLPLDQRDRRPAAHMGKPQARQHGVMALEEVRVVLQIRCNGSLFGFRGG